MIHKAFERRKAPPGRMLVVIFVVGVIWAALSVRADPGFRMVSDPGNAFSFFVMRGNAQVMKIGIAGWGPKWAWASVNGKRQGIGDPLDVAGSVVMDVPEKRLIGVHLHVAATGPRTVVMEYGLVSVDDVPLTMLAATFSSPEGGALQAVLTNAAGVQKGIQLPSGPMVVDPAKRITLSDTGWNGAIAVTMSPAIRLGVDGGIRVMFASDVVKAGETKGTLTLTFPEDVALLTKASDLDKLAPVLTTPDWFAYKPQWDMGKSVIGMEDWLDKPAGKHGGVRMVGDRFEFTDGTPVKFWGVNLSYALSAPTKADADFTADRFAKYGVNAVRMHKFTGVDWAGIGDPKDATKFTAAGMDRLDYFSSRLAAKGIYYGWSHTYHFTVRPANKSRLAGYDELMKHGGDTYGVINWAEDVQDLMIEQVVNLLEHKNPYTGKRYAEDPALNFIELQNEDDIFFYTSTAAYNNFPTYRKLLETRFGEWLLAKYGSQEKLAVAWQGALHGGETVDAGIAIQANPWFMGDQHLPSLKGGERQRMLDNGAFLFETQKRFYDKFVKAIRGTGYAGPLIGSPWQAPAMLPHYYNLLADEQVGYIDRHNYFGGTLNATMLHTPGGGYLSAGLQQVAERPFGMSEWIHVYPSLYSAEGPVIMAAYGMGLQGWDSSYEFQSSSVPPMGTDNLVNKPNGVWNADAPTQIGQYPILARMLIRGDVKEGPVISVRRVARGDLESGEFNFKDNVQQQGDIKTFGGGAGGTSSETLAAGRALVEFVGGPTVSTFADMAKYKQQQVITSATGQLNWDAGQGVITIDTSGTQGMVGFAEGKSFKLGNVTITSECPYASILLTAEEKGATLADAKRVLVSALARNANSGFRCLTIDGKTIVDNGKGPMMMEPVKAEAAFPGRHVTEVRILDHDGRTTKRMAASQRDGFVIDGVRDQALYYEVVLE